MQTVCTTSGSWQRAGASRARGAADADGAWLGAGALAARLDAVENAAGCAALLDRLNGFFALIRTRADEVLAAVDPVRSIPLFYALDGHGRLLIGDDPAGLRAALGPAPYEPLAAAEFRLTGYVTGSATLDPRIRQLQAGELLIARQDDAGPIRIETRRYYRFMRQAPDLADDRARLRARLEEVLEAAVARLLRHAGDRTIVLPLSGGYDSRLLAVLLRRHGRDRLIAFSYGRPGNRSAAISREVAARLDIPWHFVPYDNVAWRTWFGSPERAAYFACAHKLSSVPHIQDWPAVGELTRRGLVPRGAVFVPGHTGDFISGGHIPAAFLRPGPVAPDALAATILDKHYVLWDRRTAAVPAPALHARVLEVAGCREPVPAERAIELCEAWEWQERQAKFIVNAVRAYEFWEHDWWLPLWDRAVLDFWQRVPLPWRVGQRLYIDVVAELYARATGLTPAAARGREAVDWTTGIKKVIKRSALLPLARALVDAHQRRRAYDDHPLAFYGILERPRFEALFSGRENVNSFLALSLLEPDAPETFA